MSALPFIPRLVIFDFDGVMTDNTVYVDDTGREMVRCSRADGLGLSMARKAGYAMQVLSTETNPVVSARARKLELPCIQGCGDKAGYLRRYLSTHGIAPEKTLFMGNDINDLEAMRLVGCAVVPADAHPDVMPHAHLVLQARGGHGAVRELCDMLVKLKAGS